MHDVTTPVIQRSSNSELPQQDKLSNGYQDQQQQQHKLNRQHQTFQQKYNLLNNGNTDNNNNNQNKCKKIDNKKTPPPVPLKQSGHKSDAVIKIQTTIASNNDLLCKSDKNNKIIASSSSSALKNAPACDRCNENDSLPIQDNLNRQQQHHQNINDNKGQSNHSSIVYQEADNVCCTGSIANCCSKLFNSRRSDVCHNGKHFVFFF